MNPFLSVLFALSSAQAAVPRDPASLLKTLHDDLRKSSRSTGETRDKLRKAAKVVFDRELAASVPRTPRPVWSLFEDHLDDLADADRFPVKTDRAERDLWVVSCRSALARQLAHSKESNGTDAEMPTTAQVFSDAMDGAGDVKTRFGAEGLDDLKIAAIDGLNQTFRSLIRRARPPSSGDPKSQYASQLARIDQKFPVAGDTEKKANLRANNLLKDVAKAALDRALSGTK